MKPAKAALLSGLVLVSWITLVACTKEQPATGYAAAEPESRGQFWLAPPWQSPTSEEPPPIHWKDFIQAKVDAWNSSDTQAAALQRLEKKPGDASPPNLKLHVEVQPGTLLLNVWCTGGTLSHRHDFLKAAMDWFIETQQFDPRWKLLDRPIADVALADDAIRCLRKEITSNGKKSPPDEATEKMLREKLAAAKIQLQEKRQAFQVAPPIKALMQTGSIAILTPPQELPAGK
ncbi:hypothetical protein [Roseimicrobium sp. ORNL1]|uniref:hypothetical protein n=1 Tax=Roseimicrobium sp. ORNL1 TaxID=2711231 RepID=UPI0013E1FED3|nr:hypothetical protein [Roseimicrobium sp. ORNL1]QIF03222.1 hypothetical protein G5S37_17395 [Roseimicrobium sp. ORNL1]